MGTPLFDLDKPRDRLLAAAAKLFRAHGFSGTTVRDIGAEVGILSGSLFHHVRSKDEILFLVMQRVVERMTHDLRDALAQAPSPAEEIRALITVELTYLHGPASDATAVLFHEWRALSPERRKVLLQGRDAYFDLWNTTLTHARDAGLTSVDPVILRQFLHGALAWTSFWFRDDGSIDLETLAEQAFLMVLGHKVAPCG